MLLLVIVDTEMLTELSRREKEAGIKPEADIDIFMKVRFGIGLLLSMDSKGFHLYLDRSEGLSWQFLYKRVHPVKSKYGYFWNVSY